MPADDSPTASGACTFVVSSRIGLVTAEPYIDEFLRRGSTVYLCGPQEVLDDAQTRDPRLAGRGIVLERLLERHRWTVRLHAVLTALFSSRRLNRSYPLLQDPRRKPDGRKGRTLNWLAQAVPKLHPKQFNRAVDVFFCAMQRNPLPTRLVVAVSFVGAPSLLTARGQFVVTLVESWDHPVKKSAGYLSDLVVGWNRDINRDWQEFQGAADSVDGYPMKLGYALEADRHAPTEQTTRPAGVRPTAMYAVGTSSNTDRPDWYRDELQVIEELCEATATAEWSLLIKPKPNGRTGDFDHFARNFEHVEVGLYRDARHALDYYLDDDYNRQRLDELDRCELVINCWTTFALDAAASGKPVLQLDLRSMDRWPALQLGLQNYHLATYILSRKSTLVASGGSELHSVVSDQLSDAFPLACAFREELRDWIVHERPRSEVVEAVVSRVATAAG